MNTKPWAIGIVIISTAITATAQIFYKIAADKLTLDLATFLTNWQLFTGLFLYGIAAVMLILALKYGELSILYPIISLSFVWVNLLSMKFLGELIPLIKWIGIIFIIIGVSFIGFGSKHKEVTPDVN